MKKKIQKKSITANDLAKLIRESAKETREYVQKHTKKEIESLALMTAKGFRDVEDRLGGRIDGVEIRLDNVEKELGGIKGRLNGVENRLDNVVFDIADMKKGILEKLERRVEKIDFVRLDGRVRVLEKVILKQKKIDR